jgi:multidrug efflux system outer membrane protein
MLLVLPSCAISPLRHAQPGPALPGTFQGATSPENSAQLGIAEFFNDAVLTDLIEQGLLGNRELRILNEEVQIARNEVLARQGAYLPFVTFGANAELDRFSRFTLPGAGIQDDPYLPGKFLTNPLPNYLYGLNLFWQLDIWRELRNARDAAAQRYLAASERRNYFVTRLVAEIAENYYGLMARDKRLENLNQIIQLQKDSLQKAIFRYRNPRLEEKSLGDLPVKRFEAEVRKNQSQLLITKQEIIQVENRINFLANRFPQPVERQAARFYDLEFPLSVGVPAQLLLNRPDIRQAERELEAAGLDVKVARAHFFPKLAITSGVGYQAFNPRYLFEPEALIYNVAGNLIAPVINFKAIRAEYQSANAKQLQSVYNYQRVVLNAFTEVYNRVSRVQNYSQSIAFKKQQVESLVKAVDVAMDLFKNARLPYLDVLFAQRDLWDARFELIETRQEQLFAIVSVYQALGGGQIRFPDALGQGQPDSHLVGEKNRPAELSPPRLLPPVSEP